MKKVLFLFVVFCFLNLPALAQNGALRPRRSATPRTPPKVQNDTPTITPRSKPSLGDNSALPPPPPSPSEQKTLKKSEDEVIVVDTNLVTTPVSVMDRSGRFIPSLKKKDFKIFENGVPQEITYFQSEETPFTVILMIDTSPSTKYKIDEIHYAALTFVNQLRPADQVMVIAFDQRAKVLCEPTNDKKTLYSAIYKANFGSGTSLYDAVDAVAELEMVSTPGRKAVVLFTDGVDTTSRRASYQSTIAAVEEIDALFYPIRYNTQEEMRGGQQIAAMPNIPNISFPSGVAIRMRGSSEAEYARGKTYLESLAANSGGRIFEADSLTNLESSFAGVAEELRRRYSVGYYANTDRVPGERKSIKIQVTRPGSVVRSKTSYVVKEKEEPKPDPQSSGLKSW
ncbi:MAG: VWA domain-containing protein [Acidobacteria bacterium]|nr:VWA domain-containing protein [Acidobacteriota bacterium]